MWSKDEALQKVRGVQQYLAIASEILILLAFFASGMDTSLGGTMAGIPIIKWSWALVFALGVDTSFVLSWVRVRSPGRLRNLWWCIPVALGMSFVVFQPVVIQLLQQALDISFDAALSMLGINIVILVYARSIVAVVLGAILALTNVESIPPVQSANLVQQSVQSEHVSVQQVDTLPEQIGQIEGPKAHPVDELDRVVKAIMEHPEMSNRKIAEMVNVSPTTVGNRRKQIGQAEQEVR